MSCTSTDPCGQPQYSSDSVNYVGPNLVCTTIETCDTVTEAFQKAEAKVCSLQSTLVLLQNQLNSLTTTTSTSSTSTTSTTIYSTTTTTTTAAEPLSFNLFTQTRESTGNIYQIRIRINSGSWIVIPGGFSNPLSMTYYSSGIDFSSYGAQLGDTLSVAIMFPLGSNYRFGNGFTSSAGSGDWSSNCGITSPFVFVIDNNPKYINIDVSSGFIVSC